MIYDIFLLILAIIFIINGLKKGAICMIFKLCSFLLSLYLIPYIKPVIEIFLSNYNKVIIYVVSFIVIFVILNILINFIERFINAIHLGGINKLVGAIISLVEAFGIGFIVLVVMLFIKNNEKIQNTLDTSYAAYYISINTKELNKYFPEKIREKLDDFNLKNENIKLKNDIYNKIKKGVNTNEN